MAIGFYFGRYVGALILSLIYLKYTNKLENVTRVLSRLFHSVNQRANSQSAQANQSAQLAQSDQATNAWAYQLLEVSETDSAKAIKHARKRLINRYHPDKIPQADELARQRANEKIHAINRAFQVIMDARES